MLTQTVIAVLEKNLIGIKIIRCERFLEDLNQHVRTNKYWRITYQRRMFKHDVVTFILDDKIYIYPYMAKDTITEETLEQIQYASFPILT